MTYPDPACSPTSESFNNPDDILNGMQFLFEQYKNEIQLVSLKSNIFKILYNSYMQNIHFKLEQ